MGETEVAEFLTRLSARDAAAAWLARELMQAGWSVHDFFGPVQMDVWQLVLRRGSCRVRFGIERGYSDGVAVADGVTGGDGAAVADRAVAYRPITVAMSEKKSAVASVMSDPAAALEWLTRRSG
ncbi:hypothetical protein [Microbacterium hydrocarbonoxydans]|uniref:DUF5655 domain-containing protein n=1 Tax=Microbacterium hydrocarbonoxydans TaxID=273678 RepID=A0A1H4QUK9_9MICO|nr:hypothetical protein [Microbacterium hydrocarbonoxydans]SEC23242.1 hypothetical protein SAMN04489807_3204 [Microbacterium hydrocarbonoxydans]